MCTELRLDVTQPELRGISMTALHRAWLTDRVPEARDHVSMLVIEDLQLGHRFDQLTVRNPFISG